MFLVIFGCSTLLNTIIEMYTERYTTIYFDTYLFLLIKFVFIAKLSIINERLL